MTVGIDKKIEIGENERIDDLQLKGLKIIQNKEGFCFGLDAVLLANYSKIKNNARVLDLGTGTGIIPILLAGKSRAKLIYGVEIQDEVSEMALRSVKLNNLEDRIKIIGDDIKNLSSYVEKNSFDVVISNPPYMNPNGLVNQNDKKAISRHEIKSGLEDFIVTASKFLKPNGKLFMINRTLRLVDMIYFARAYNLEPKVLRFVHSKISRAPKLVLAEFIKNGKSEVKIESPLYVHREDGSYTDEIKEIYSNPSVGL